MKKWQIVVLVISISIVLITGLFIFKYPEIRLNNQGYDYVQAYLSNLPTDKSILEDIDSVTYKLINENIYDKSSFLSKYQLRHIKERIFFGKGDYKNEYLHEIVCLRLKVLAVSGKEQEYKELFNLYIYDIIEGYLTSYMYIDAWNTETSFPLEYNNKIYTIVIPNYETATENCTNVGTKFTMLNQMRYFYQLFEETQDKCEYYRQKVIDFSNSNISDISNELGKRYHDEFYINLYD